MTISHAQLHLRILLLVFVDVRLTLCVMLREEHALGLRILRPQSPLL